MKEQLKLLEALQETDKEVREIEEKTNHFPKEIEKIEASLGESEEKVLEIKEAIESHEKERREKDADLSDNTENLSKFRERQRNIKTNAEYQAVLREIDQAKKLNKEIEEQVLTLMEELEEEATKLSAAESVFEEEKKQAEDQKKEFAEKKAEVEKKLKSILAKRTKNLKAVDPEVSKIYETLKVKIKGFVLARTNNGSCSGCYMHLPPQLINDAMRFEKICQCPHCKRILLVE